MGHSHGGVGGPEGVSGGAGLVVAPWDSLVCSMAQCGVLRVVLGSGPSPCHKELRCGEMRYMGLEC